MLTDYSYLIQKHFFRLNLIEEKDGMILDCSVWKLVNTKL